MNIGLINESLIFKSGFDSDTKLYESFINDVKSSDYLMNEFITFKNITEYNVSLGKKDLQEYIKENLDHLKNYGTKTPKIERKKLAKYSQYITSENKIHTLINTLIEECVLKPKTKTNVNKVYESYNMIFNLLTEKDIKPSNEETTTVVNVQESISNDELDMILKNVQKMYNDKYSSLLSEEEQRILMLFTNGSSEEKKTLFEDLKTKAINTINAEKDNITTDLYESSILKVNSLSTSNTQVLDESIMSLLEIIF